MLNARNKQVQYGLNIMKLLEAVQLQKMWQLFTVRVIKRNKRNIQK